MGLFDEIRKALMDLVVVLPKLNREHRKEIREVVLQLQSELERSITLAIFYLDGVSRIKPRQELLDHLYHAPQSLMDTYNEYKICAGLYGLADRFNEWFSSIRGSVNVNQIQSVETLIRDLAGGERLVIDGLRGTTQTLADAARELELLHDEEYEERKAALYERVALERNELRNQIEWLSRTVRDVLKKM